MKKIIYTIFFIVGFLNAKSQISANAGLDLHSCDMDTNANSILIGGNPAASNGTPPYNYSWSINPIELGFPGSGLFYHASNILNDTTLSNPSIIERYASASITLFLKITDATGSVAYDTCKVTFSNFMEHLMWYSWTINSGDSAYIDVGSNVGGGVGALTYLWKPSSSLSDSTIELGFWAKPITSTNYYVTVTDSIGCQRTGAPFCLVNVNTVGINETIFKNTLNLFPNPSNDKIIIPVFNKDCMLNINSNSGQTVINTIYTGSQTIDINKLSKGIYTFIVTDNKQNIIGNGKFIKD